jgi:mannose-6-phosphate isomerase-like protein (cupin superfamily)
MVKITGKTDYTRAECAGLWRRSFDAAPGDVTVTPAGTAHGYEVIGDEPARVVCVDSPTRPKPA